MYRGIIGKASIIQLVKGQAETAQNKSDTKHITAKALAAVSGIGRQTADGIIEFRKGNRHFRSADGLLKVPGVDGATLLKLKEQVVFLP